MLKELRRLFIVGIFTVAPLGLTIYVIVQLFAGFDAIFQPLAHPIIRNFYDKPIPGLGLIIGLFFILGVGLVAPSLIGKQLLLFTERTVQRLPLAKMIYSGSKQIFDSFSGSKMDKFSRVVAVEFPRPGIYAIGFVTHEGKASLVPGKENLNIAVFLPTTPNPTSGYLLFVSEKDAISLKMSVEEALKMVVSGGLVLPENFSKTS